MLKFVTFQSYFYLSVSPLLQAIFSLLVTDIHSETLLIADTDILTDVADIQYPVHLLVEH